MIQRAFVLMGRNKPLRQKLRSVALTTRWTVEEWGLEWTALLADGKFEFYRGHVGKAQATFRWKTGDGFLQDFSLDGTPTEEFGFECQPGQRRVADTILQAFRATLCMVLADPVDDAGVRLL